MFAQQFRSLWVRERRGFIPASWAHRGSDTDVRDGGVLIHGAETERLVVVDRFPWSHDAEFGEVDVVVSTHDSALARLFSRIGRGGSAKRHDATFVPPEKLRELFVDAIDQDAEAQLSTEYFGTSLRQEHHQQTSVRSLYTSAVVLLVATIAAVGSVGLPFAQDNPEPGAEAGAAGQSTDEARGSSPVNVPPGLSAEGITSSDLLLRGYYSHVDEKSFVVTLNYSGPPNWRSRGAFSTTRRSG